jgi:hypothetical protein
MNKTEDVGTVRMCPIRMYLGIDMYPILGIRSKTKANQFN